MPLPPSPQALSAAMKRIEDEWVLLQSSGIVSGAIPRSKANGHMLQRCAQAASTASHTCGVRITEEQSAVTSN
jgi:hypothetical protein